MSHDYSGGNQVQVITATTYMKRCVLLLSLEASNARVDWVQKRILARVTAELWQFLLPNLLSTLLLIVASGVSIADKADKAVSPI